MQIKTFYLNDNITLVDATALAQVSIINIMQISAPPPPPPTFRLRPAVTQTLNSVVRVRAYTHAHVLAPSRISPFFIPLLSHPAFVGPLMPPLLSSFSLLYSRDVHSLKAADRVHSQFYRCSDRLTVAFPFHSVRLDSRAFLVDSSRFNWLPKFFFREILDISIIVVR